MTSVIEAATAEDRLRAALKAGHPDARGHVAARIACAHLAAGDLTEAYFALLHARDHMLGPTDDAIAQQITAAPSTGRPVGGTPARFHRCRGSGTRHRPANPCGRATRPETEAPDLTDGAIPASGDSAEPTPDPAERDAYFPSPYSLGQYVPPRTDDDGTEHEGDAAGRWKILVIGADERYLPMGNGRLFSTGNHPVETVKPTSKKAHPSLAPGPLRPGLGAHRR